MDSPELVERVPEELSEEELRQLYDNEEVERFLQVFASHVSEVELRVENQESVRKEESEELVTETGVTLSERIAFRYLLPVLPPPPLPPPVFTLGRLRITIQRLYLSIWPVYVPFFIHLVGLCTWKDRSKSMRYCIVFWILWYHNILLPAVFFRILYALIRRKIFTYPTVAELKQRRKQVDRANELGEEVSIRLSTTSFGLKEMWRISRIITKSKPGKVKKNKTPKVPIPDDPSESPDTHVDEPTVLDDTKESQQETDLKRAGLQALNEIADLHERVKNIFIWRKPASSKVYGSALFFCCIVTLFLPAQYIAKLVYFLGGVFFWHIIPILAALPSEDRARFPPAFNDVPTDADFAMEVISQRIAAGLDINPSKGQSRSKRDMTSEINQTVDSSMSTPGTPGGSKNDKDKDINWKKWGERAAIGKAWVVEKKIGSNNPLASAMTSHTSLIPETSTPQPSTGTHTFPCQHTSAPGLLTLTPTAVFFTPMTSSNPKLSIPFTDLRGVKKSGLLKGITIKWLDSHTTGEVQQEVFLWVGGRDEIFARLIGTDVKRWMKA